MIVCVFSTNVAGITRQSHVKKKKNLDTDLICVKKIKSKWITDPNVKHKTTKFLEYNVGENLDDLGCGDNILDKIPKACLVSSMIHKSNH